MNHLALRLAASAAWALALGTAVRQSPRSARPPLSWVPAADPVAAFVLPAASATGAPQHRRAA